MTRAGMCEVGKSLLCGLTVTLVVGCTSNGLPESVLSQVQSDLQAESHAQRSPSDRRNLTPVAVTLPPARPVFRSIDDWTVQEAAEHALGRMGPDAVPALLEKLRYRDPDPARQEHVRKRAAEVIAQLGPAAQSAVPDLIEALHDPSVEVRKSAALALGQIGPAAAAAVPDLVQLMLKTDESPAETPTGLPAP
jgi:HEAT repeat protein